ncbi:MAG: hypothetical protein HGA87_00125 [Desulfobulbaceae bacterium]|nr:hypothetical protein [Desulfobulbaceae bacterium]
MNDSQPAQVEEQSFEQQFETDTAGYATLEEPQAVNPKAEPAEQQEQEEPVAAEPKADDQAEQGQAPVENDGEDDPVQRAVRKVQRGAERKIGKLTKRLKELESAINNLPDSRRDQLSNQGAPTEHGDEPNLTDYDSYDEYQAAVDARQAAKPAKQEQSGEAPVIPEDVQDAIDAVKDSIEDGKRKYKDFEQVISAPDFVQSNDVMLAIAESDHPEDVVYYLATHKEELAAINQMSPVRQAKEIGKIEAKLSLPQEKPKPKQSSAPPPPSPVNGDSSAGAKTYADMDMRTFMRVRNKEERDRRY